jgi:tripartite-type tricarboxylate transporter receptor subunit TctC
MASAGSGTSNQLVGEFFQSVTGTSFLHVPYKGGAEVAQAIASGEIDIFAGSPLLLAPLAKAGRVKAIAIAKMSRAEVLPDMPTMTESGYPNFVSSSWYGVFGPAKMPPEILKSLSDAIVATVNSHEYFKRMANLSVEATAMGHVEFAKYTLSESKSWRVLLESSGIKTVR